MLFGAQTTISCPPLPRQLKNHIYSKLNITMRDTQIRDENEMKTRREARESAMQALYYFDTADQWVEESLLSFQRLFLTDITSSPITTYFKKLVQGVLQNRTAIDSQIEEASDRWKLARMAIVDRNIIRIATYELMHEPEVPPRVIINEAIEIAKAFGDTHSPAFINGVLDNIASKNSHGAVNADQIRTPLRLRKSSQ